MRIDVNIHNNINTECPEVPLTAHHIQYKKKYSKYIPQHT